MMAKKSFLIMGSNVLAALIGFVALTSMTRFVGQEYGSLMWAMSFVATFNAVYDLGFSTAHVKKISEGENLDSCISTFAFIKIGLTVLMIAAALAFLFIYTVILEKEIFSATLEVLILFILYWALCNISGIFISTYNAKREISKSEIIHLADPLIRAPMIIILAFWQMSAFHLSIAYVIGALAATSVGLFFMMRDGIKLGKPIFFRPYLKYAKPLIVITLVGAVLANLDKVILGFFWDDYQVGYYMASYKLIELVLTFGVAINVLLFPTFSEWHSQGKEKDIKPVSNEAQRFVSMIGMPITAFLVVFSYPAASLLFGSGYIEAGGTMMFLSLALYIMLIIGIFEQIILAYNRPERMVKVFLVRLVVNLILILVFVPTSFVGYPMLGLKASGAALAFLCAWLVYAVMIIFTSHEISGMWPNNKLWIHILAGLLTIATLYFVSLTITISNLFILIGLAILAEVLFFGLLAVFKEFKKDDLDLIISVLNPKDLLSYVRDEISKK